MADEWLEGYDRGSYDAGLIFVEELYGAPFLKRLWACMIILFNNKNKIKYFKDGFKELEKEE